MAHLWVLLVAMSCAALSGCSSDDDAGDGGTPVPTATTAATLTPTQPLTPTAEHTPVATATPVLGAAVRGVLVVDAAVAANDGDALGGAPEQTFADPRFDRSLAFAEWSLHCDGQTGENLRGVTDESGRFAVADLPPGECTLFVTKTVSGNLMSFDVPFTVGDDGAAEVTAEVSWGRVRVTSLYTAGGNDLRKITTNEGLYVLIRNGRIVEIADYARRLVDDDGDGLFETVGCDDSFWQCSDFEDCGQGRRCMCTSSCPFCDDCGPPICAAGLTYSPYRCGDNGSCANPGDRCVCVESNAGAGDCPQQVCVAPCAAVSLEAIRVFGVNTLIAGQETTFSAHVILSDGSSVDVSGIGDWTTSDASVLDVGVWGYIRARAEGVATVSVALAGLNSDGTLVTVAARPPLVQIYLQNFDCYPRHFGPLEPRPFPDAPHFDAGFAPPFCLDAIEVGQSVQFHALGEFVGGHYEDITDEVEWQATPQSVGTIVSGRFVGLGQGTAAISAALGEIVSDTRELRVVTERSVVDVSIYPESQFFYGFLPVGDVAPCFDFFCPGSLTLLLGDEVQFRATARFDTGGWQDVTEQATWQSSNSAAAAFAANGLLTTTGEGEASVSATLGSVESYPYGLNVVAEATLQYLEIYQTGDNAQDRVIETGGQALFIAQGYYDVGFGRDATADATWRTSDAAVARFDSPGELTGLSAGVVEVWAELDGVSTQRLAIEVFAPTDIDFCDVENVNRGVWTDGFNRVYLESDCDAYSRSEVVQIRFTVTERERPFGIFDPCLDLYAFRVEDERETFVRTIREEGCGEPFLAAGAPEFDDARLRYQLQAFWDLKNDAGATVAPGTYRIKGRFYLYYDPVVTIDITVD